MTPEMNFSNHTYTAEARDEVLQGREEGFPRTKTTPLKRRNICQYAKTQNPEQQRHNCSPATSHEIYRKPL